MIKSNESHDYEQNMLGNEVLVMFSICRLLFSSPWGSVSPFSCPDILGIMQPQLYTEIV